MGKNICKKILSMVLLVFLIMGEAPVFASPAPISGNWTDYAAEPVCDNTTGIYTVKSAEELAWVAVQVNGGNTFSGKTIELLDDIDLKDHYWTPIGMDDSNSFQGAFDGKGNVISGLSIGTPGSPDAVLEYVGLFGNTNGAGIKKVTVKDASVYSSTPRAYVAGLVGYAYSTEITNCIATGSVTGGDYSDVGVLVGVANQLSKIINSYATGSTNGGSTAYVGCLAGIVSFSSEITNSYATGNVVGGQYSNAGCLVASASSSTITNCYATGRVIGGSNAYIGGLVGVAFFSQITNCYATGFVHGGTDADVGVFMGCDWYSNTVSYAYWKDSTAEGVGSGTAYTIEMTSEDMQKQEFADLLSSNASALDNDVLRPWKIASDINDGYPTFGDTVPSVVDVSIYGTVQVGQALTGSYTYNDADGDDESGTTYQWYCSDDASGTVSVAVYGAVDKTYVLTDDDEGCYIAFQVTPSDGENVGPAVKSDYVGAVTSPVPGVPVLQSAEAGGGHVNITWSPVEGSTGYKVYTSTISNTYDSVYESVCSSVYSSDVMGLTNGTTYYFVVSATNPWGDSTYSNELSATPYRHSSGGSSKSSKTSAESDEAGVEILINGKTETAATAATTEEDGKTIITITIDDKKVEEKLEKEGKNAIITIPVNNDADVVVGRLNGETVKNMERKAAVLEIKTKKVTYILPASQINIDAVSEQIGEQVKLKDIAVNVKISEPPQETVRIVEDTADKNNYQLIVGPVEFEITCSNGSETVGVCKFNNYVERMVAVPDNVDLQKITTAVVLNNDGSFSHVPTVITAIDGKYYAKISSLTNSTYSVIWNPIAFKDTENHWAKKAVNGMSSRLVIDSVGAGKFEPDSDITRAEFTTVVIKALGLMRSGMDKKAIEDVTKDTRYYNALSIAHEYGIISGYGNVEFGPMDKTTREQAIAIISRAMNITGLKVELKEGEAKNILAVFVDSGQISDWAQESMAACIKAGIVAGKVGDALAPKDEITRAEVAVIVRRLLTKSGLI